MFWSHFRECQNVIQRLLHSSREGVSECWFRRKAEHHFPCGFYFCKLTVCAYDIYVNGESAGLFVFHLINHCYTFHGHLIRSHIKGVVAEWL